MIPLVKPESPSWMRVERYFKKSRELGKLTNFGPCYYELSEKLNEINSRYNIPCANGTAAIQLAAQAHFRRGSRVICPDYTHIGTVQALVAAGMTPILAPVSKTSWTLNAAVLVSEHVDSFDAIIVVSPFGYSVDFKVYDQLAKELNKPIIYDLAGAFGIDIETKNPVTFSMHATKNLSVGEGGIASFTNIAEASDAMRLSCFDQNVERSIHSPYGNNLKIDEARCAIALALLEDTDEIERRYKRKIELIDLYQSLLGNYLIPHDRHRKGAPSLCVLSGLPAQRLEQRSAYLGFEVKQYYPLLSDMPGLASISCISKSSQFFKTCAALPSSVSNEQAADIARAIITEVRARHAKDRLH